MSVDNKGKDEIFPVVILSSNGGVLGVSRINEKGYKKSLENDELWHLVPETERLLPFEMGEGFRFKSIKRREGWVEVVYTPVGGSKGGESNVQESEGDWKRGVSGRVFPDIDVIERVALIIKERKKGKEGSYTSYLFGEGSEKIRKKLGEEAVELILAGKRDEIIYEAADLLYHLLVLLENEEIDLNEVFLELKSRMEK